MVGQPDHRGIGTLRCDNTYRGSQPPWFRMPTNPVFFRGHRAASKPGDWWFNDRPDTLNLIPPMSAMTLKTCERGFASSSQSPCLTSLNYRGLPVR